MTLHVGEAEISTCIAVGQLLVIDTELVKDCGVQIVDRDTVFNSLKPKFVRSAVGKAALHPSAGEPHCIAIRIVVSPVTGLRYRRAPEFTTPYDKRLA